MPPQKKTPLKILVAIDFGTTYSSMAWATSTNPDERDVITWWGDGAMTGANVPTRLQYRDGVARGRKPSRWGLSVEPEDPALGTVYEWFKLKLYSRLKDDELERIYPLRRNIVSEDESKQLVVDYLVAMRENFLAWIPKMLSQVEIGHTPVEYIVTVPAIWTDMTKALTRACAIEAGLGSADGTIEMIREPEAAGLHALQSGIGLTLQADQTFVLCDAGGGTVDLISFTVASLNPRSLVEAAPGSGGLCGSTFLNRAFEAWLDRRFQGVAGFDQSLKSHVMLQFEQKIKKRFIGSAGGPYKCQVIGLANNYALGVLNGCLTIPTNELRAIFKEVTDRVVKLVMDQISATKPRHVTTVVLAGGFGANEYLAIELKRAIGRTELETAVKHVMHSDTAVVRGALLRALTRTNSNIPIARTEGRIAAKSYGIGKFVPFDKNKHDSSKREWDPYEGDYRVQIIDWFLRYGNRCDENEPKYVKLSSRKSSHGKSLAAMPIVVYIHEHSNERPPPKHVTDDVESILEVTAQLNEIPIRTLRTSIGCDNEQYLSADFDLEATLDAQNMLQLVVKHEGSSYGAASVNVAFLDSP